MLPTAGQAGGGMVGPVQFHDPATSGHLVKHVDILGDDRRQGPGLFQFGQEVLAEGRANILHHLDEIPRKFVKVPGRVPKPRHGGSSQVFRVNHGEIGRAHV